MSPQPSAPEFDWEAAGRELGSKVDRLHALAVLGNNDDNTARVALGIARQQATRRRVAIGDLLGEAAPIQSLVSGDDPHGLADVFEYGVSLDKVARKVEIGGAELYVLPAGADLVNQAEIFANRRWSRLAAGFRKENGLLIVAANVGTPDIESLVIQLDGAVLVGDLAPSRLPISRVLGMIRGPHRASRRHLQAILPPRPRYEITGARSLKRVTASVGLALAAAIAALGFWLASRPLASTKWTPTWLRAAPVSADSATKLLDGHAAPADTGMAIAPHFGLLTKMDSSAISPYGISLVTFNTQAGALLELQRNGTSLRAGTYTPVLIRETPWYRVVAGAYPDSASAAALLDTLRARGKSDAGRATIERFPYALLVERDVPDTAVGTRVAKLQDRGLPVYALLQSDNTARVYIGAFKEPEEAVSLYDALRSSGISTTLVYRTGRVY
ncbi:MAG TPA: SPOR domain-containing protein [Gemmatimonadaceae bacterium]|nr:SPOR domain-containing protein [Gemmatimonadaceae bacterium]